MTKCAPTRTIMIVKPLFITSPPEGVARYCFDPVCASVCPANILVFYFSPIRRDIDLKFIQDTYMVVINAHTKFTNFSQNVVKIFLLLGLF